MQAGWTFWIDRGGTFTDIVARAPDGRLLTHKLLSEDPARYEDATLAGMRALLGLAPDEPFPANAISEVRMGTTLATNALLTRTGAKVAWITTAGFEDALLIGDQHRPDIFALCIRKPAPLYACVMGVRERVAADGTVLEPLDEAGLREAIAAAQRAGMEAVAIAFLHAHAHPEHERRAAALARAAGFRHVVASHEAAAVRKFLPRAHTAVVDAYLTPVVRDYAERLARALPPDARLEFMQSHGGLVPAQELRGRNALFSGPAGGINAALKTARRLGIERIVSFDMGGTSTDVAVCDGELGRKYEGEVEGLPLAVPSFDIRTVAAGGGSVLAFDGEILRVGPHSCGAQPGPACYGRGGPLALTDANLMVGRIDPHAFPRVFGPHGDAPLDVATARAAFARLAEEVGAATGRAWTVEELADGYLAVAVETMVAAIRRITLDRGLDPAEFTLCCFGGAGGQLACRVAAALGISRILVHPLAGLLSAYGMGLADERLVREVPVGEILDENLVRSLKARFAAEAETARARRSRRGIAADAVLCEARVRIRPVGRETALSLPLTDFASLVRDFRRDWEKLYGFAEEHAALEVESLILETIVPGRDPLPLPVPSGAGQPRAEVWLYVDGERLATPAYDRGDLAAGQVIHGPALVNEPATTVVVDPGWAAEVLAGGELVLTRQAGKAARRQAGDAVRLALFERRFMAIAEDMGRVLAHTAHSVNIRERLDFSCALFDDEGRLIANAPHIPVHLGSMGDAVAAIRARFAHEFAPGDAFLVNSPYAGGTHLPDLTVVAPVFFGGELIGLTAARGHHADVGGITPGSIPPHSRVIDEEGLCCEGLCIVKGGRFLDDAVMAWLTQALHPARNPVQNLLDLKAQVAACTRGASLLLALAEREGVPALRHYMARALAHGSRAVRQAIARLRPGSAEVAMDNGAMIRVSVMPDQAAGTVLVDFTGTSCAQPDNFNAPAAVARAAVLYVFRTLVGEDIPLNAGCLVPLTIVLPEDSLVNPRAPRAVVAGNVETSQAIVDALYAALGVAAASQGTMNNLTFGNAEHQYYETLGGGAGAGRDCDGASGVHTHMTNSRLTDVEVLERRYPVRVERFALRRGSGGAGRRRGGDGLVRALRFLAPMQVSLLTDRRRHAPFGLAGGSPGKPGENRLRSRDGRVVLLQGSVSFTCAAGDLLEILTPGGGSYGVPATSEERTGGDGAQEFVA